MNSGQQTATTWGIGDYVRRWLRWASGGLAGKSVAVGGTTCNEFSGLGWRRGCLASINSQNRIASSVLNLRHLHPRQFSVAFAALHRAPAYSHRASSCTGTLPRRLT